jgi:hypothetical protein
MGIFNKKNDTDFTTQIWQKYEKTKAYMQKKSILSDSERNWNFYIGKQWEAVKGSAGLEDKPIQNFVKQVVKYKVHSISQRDVTAIFSDVTGEYADVCSNIGKLFDISWEKSSMGRISRKALKAAAIQGDSYVFWYGGDTRKKPQILNNTQMLFGDENISELQEQPYIIIEERLGVETVKARARDNGLPDSEIALLREDGATSDTLLNKDEVGNKITSLVYLERKDGVIHVARATRTVVYEPLHPIKQRKNGEYYGVGLSMYPIVPMVWEEVPNSARGVSEVSEIVANQLELNKMLARRSESVKQTAFPRMAVDRTAVANPEDLDKVGATIEVNGGNSKAIDTMISYLAPQAQAGDAKQLSDELLNTTKDLAGASDTALGNIELSRVSGTAATTVRDQQQVTLNEQADMFKEFVENVALLYFDLWKTFYPDGVKFEQVEVTAEELQKIEPTVRIDVSENTTLSRVAEQQEVTNLFNNNKITFDEFVKLYPEHATIDKKRLQEILQARQEAEKQQKQEMAQQQQMIATQGGEQPIDNNVPSDEINNDVGGGNAPSYQDIQSQLAQK